MEDLPLELLLVICDLLPTRDKICLSCVNQRFHRIFNSTPSFNRHVSFKNAWDVPSVRVTQYIRRHAMVVTHLNLQNCYWLNPSELSKSLLKLTNLEFLDTRGCVLNVDILIKILSNNNNLEHLGWSVDKKTMCLFAGEPLKNLQKVLKLHKNVITAFKGLSSLRLSFFMGVPGCFEDTQSLSRVLAVFLHGLELNYVELSWPDCSSETGNCTMYEAKDIVIQAARGEKTSLFSFNSDNVINTANDVQSAFSLGQIWYFYWNFFTPNMNSDRSMWIFPTYKTQLNLLNSQKGNYIFKNEDNSDKTMYSVDISSCLSMKEHFAELCGHADRVKSLKYFKIADSSVDSDYLKSSFFPELQSLNLQACMRCLQPDLTGLKTLISNSCHLKHLNLGFMDYHKKCTHITTAELLDVLSGCKTLVSLTLPSCAIISSEATVNPSQAKDIQTALSNTDDGLKDGTIGASTDGDSAAASSRLPAFEELVESCQHMQEFELIHDFYYSLLAANFPVPYQSNEGSHIKKSCACILDNALLQPIGSWRYLRRLTLAGLTLSGNGDFLITITRQCAMLEFLSLAHLLPTLGHSSGIVNLHKALLLCHNLKDFRLEQLHFNITSQFLASLYQARNLERVCLITKNGKLAKQTLVPWLDNCCKMIFVQVFCDVSKKDCKEINKTLTARYSASRPGFCVGFYSYVTHANEGNQFDPGLSLTTPTIHLNELTLFSSRVATDWRLGRTGR